jgi:uncharacterized protein with von Willebrand factor type A (vWA) domain
VQVGLTAIGDFVRALETAPPDSRSRLYWTARVSLVRRQCDLGAFDAVFAAVFEDAVVEMDPNARRKPLASSYGEDDSFASAAGSALDEQAGSGLPWLTLPPPVSDAEDSDTLFAVPERLPSAIAGLTDVAFDHLTPQQLQLLGGWLESAIPAWPTRRTRRTAIDPNGHRIALRATIAESRHTGWEPVKLLRAKAVVKPRPVVMLCDVSQSMQAQVAAYLHLMRALAVTADAEIFAFSTHLTRLTAVLSHTSPQKAIEQATDKVTDRFGGTRIAANLSAVMASHHGGALRGAIVIIASDGWDSGPAAALAAAMARLRRRAHLVIWMNPRAAAPDFEPLVATMAAALPYCDLLLPADTFRSLAAVVGAVSRGVSSTASRGSRAGSGRR